MSLRGDPHHQLGRTIIGMLAATAMYASSTACSTSSGFLDAAMPDRIGTGTAFERGDYHSRSNTGGALGVEGATEI